jgi:antitoxin CptB
MTDEDLKRMRWASRRGMLELDLVLEPFVNTCYAGLDEVDRQRYRQLMECEDQDMFGWFLKQQRPEDPEIANIVDKILHFIHARHRAG